MNGCINKHEFSLEIYWMWIMAISLYIYFFAEVNAIIFDLLQNFDYVKKLNRSKVHFYHI